MSVCKFTHDSSIETIDGGFVIYWNSGLEQYRLEDIGAESDVVNLDDGLAHLFGRRAIYEVRADSAARFTISKVAIRL